MLLLGERLGSCFRHSIAPPKRLHRFPCKSAEELYILVRALHLALHGLNLLLELSNELELGVFIFNRGVRNISCLGRIGKCADVLLEEVITGGHTCQHQTVAISSQ